MCTTSPDGLYGAYMEAGPRKISYSALKAALQNLERPTYSGISHRGLVSEDKEYQESGLQARGTIYTMSIGRGILKGNWGFKLIDPCPELRVFVELENWEGA